MLRFYIEASEPNSADPNDRLAHLNYRLQSIIYWQKYSGSGKVVYAFRGNEGKSFHAIVKPNDLEDLDRVIKADPSWFFMTPNVIPVTTTASMLNEIFGAIPKERFMSLGANEADHTFTADEMKTLDDDLQPIDPDGMYTLAEKRALPFSASATSEERDLIWSKTVASQRMHLADIEFMDHNPVGQPVGLLVAKGNVADVEKHVSSAPIFPHTTVKFIKLLTLKQAWRVTNEELQNEIFK